MVDISLDELMALAKPLPRYTSYPTAPEWESLSFVDVEKKIEELKKTDAPLSLYFHIPFCKSMCLYCGCSVVLNRKKENELRYVDALIKEIHLTARLLGKKRTVTQIHFGGGTPTKLDEAELDRILFAINDAFELASDAEVAIEIDPRTVTEDKGRKLHHLWKLGFNRVSFGVQDTNSKVQEAVKRRQSYEMTRWTYELAREIGFDKINVDLIYGLPYQTIETFSDTVEKIAELQPDRIALFSYAKVPWLKAHQKAIKDETLPSVEEKFRIYLMSRKYFIGHGYTGIGMDHFALDSDELAKAYKSGQLHRNFQGYTTKPAEDLLAFGVTGIGFFRDAYFQNVKELDEYYAAIEAGKLPVLRGKILNHEDKLRRWVINELMCHFKLDKQLFEKRWGEKFDEHFKEVFGNLAECEAQGLVHLTKEQIQVTEKGELFLRNVVAGFDAYLARKENQKRFSSAV